MSDNAVHTGKFADEQDTLGFAAEAPSQSETKIPLNMNNILSSAVRDAAPILFPDVIDAIDDKAASIANRADLARVVTVLVSRLLKEHQILLNPREQRDLVTVLINNILWLRPDATMTQSNSGNNVGLTLRDPQSACGRPSSLRNSDLQSFGQATL